MLVRYTIIYKYLRFLVNLTVSRKLSVKILHILGIGKSSWRFSHLDNLKFIT